MYLVLTRYRPKAKIVNKKRLVSSDESEILKEKGAQDEIDTSIPRPIISYWWPNMTLNVVANDQKIPTTNYPQVMKRKFETKKYQFDIYYRYTTYKRWLTLFSYPCC